MEFEAEIVYLRSKGCSTKDIQTLLNEYFGLERRYVSEFINYMYQ